MKHVGFPPCLGPSGLDPCSSVTRTRTNAETHFTADEVGPARYWSEHGRVRIDPPHSNRRIWIGRLVAHRSRACTGQH